MPAKTVTIYFYNYIATHVASGQITTNQQELN